MDGNRENSFWKHNGRLVPGRPSPKKDGKPLNRNAKGPIGSTSFQDFQNSVRDAWDIGDDEFCIVSEMSSKCWSLTLITFSHFLLSQKKQKPKQNLILPQMQKFRKKCLSRRQ